MTLLGLQGDYAYSFLLGIAAAVNPCGFVMLPAYLTYFVGTDHASPDLPARLRHALRAGAAISTAFISVFLVVGLITRLVTGWLQDQSKWAGFAIGIAMVVAGVAMLAGWHPSLPTGRLAPQPRRQRSYRSMFIFGVAYAVASIGCTIGLFVAGVFGSFQRRGYLPGVASIVLYGAGMSFLVIALTVAAAFARDGLQRALRPVSAHLGLLAATVMILSGAYVAWYWYRGITQATGSDLVTQRVGGWQVSVHGWLQQRGAVVLATALTAAIVVAAVLARRRNGRGRAAQNQLPEAPTPTASAVEGRGTRP